MIEELDLVVLTHDLPDEGLRQGDVGNVGHCYADRAAYEAESVTAEGAALRDLQRLQEAE